MSKFKKDWNKIQKVSNSYSVVFLPMSKFKKDWNISPFRKSLFKCVLFTHVQIQEGLKHAALVLSEMRLASFLPMSKFKKDWNPKAYPNAVSDNTAFYPCPNSRRIETWTVFGFHS